jgi:hypothetical protein
MWNIQRNVDIYLTKKPRKGKRRQIINSTDMSIHQSCLLQLFTICDVAKERSDATVNEWEQTWSWIMKGKGRDLSSHLGLWVQHQTYINKLIMQAKHVQWAGETILGGAICRQIVAAWLTYLTGWRVLTTRPVHKDIFRMTLKFVLRQLQSIFIHRHILLGQNDVALCFEGWCFLSIQI